MKIKCTYFDNQKSDESNSKKNTNTTTKEFSSIEELKELNQRVGDHNIESIHVEINGQYEPIVITTQKGEEDFTIEGNPHLSQDKSNLYKTHLYKFEILNYSPRFLDITSIYISKNIEKQIEESANKAINEISKMALKIRKEINENNPNKLKIK